MRISIRRRVAPGLMIATLCMLLTGCEPGPSMERTQNLPVTIEGAVRLDTVQVASAEADGWDAPFASVDVFDAGGTWVLRHTGGVFDCAARVSLSLDAADGTLRIVETSEFDSAASMTFCAFDIAAELGTLDPGIYALEVFDESMDRVWSDTFEVAAAPASCGKAGYKFLSFSTEGKCCSPTKPMVMKKPSAGKCIGLKCPCFICLNCGDGICDQYEDFCNCPDDCGKTCHKTKPFVKWGGDLDSMCCSGLKAIKQASYLNGKCSWPKTPAYVCTKCGNGTCDTGENPCNCEQDCPKTKKCGPFLGGTCPTGQVCDIGSCMLGATGTCVPKPKVCESFMYQPVCGCDGITYANPCSRLQAGVPLDHAGECKVEEKKCGPFPGGSCPDGQVCDIQSCGLGASGTCKAKPDMCTALYKPVCGCDGKTYGNDCERLRAGAQLAHDGKC